jgi:hypothetical protein
MPAGAGKEHRLFTVQALGDRGELVLERDARARGGEPIGVVQAPQPRPQRAPVRVRGGGFAAYIGLESRRLFPGRQRGRHGTAQAPLNCGARLAWNASTPSRKSSEVRSRE